MEENEVKNELFICRIKENNVFTKEDISAIINNKILYEKCYFLGILDSQ